MAPWPFFPQIFYIQKDNPTVFAQQYIDFDFQPYAPLVEFVLSKWGNWSATALSQWSHRKGSAWEKAGHKNPYIPHRIALDPSDIYEDFREYVKSE